MIPWIQVYSNLITHPKTSHLADTLKLTSKDTSADVVAAGMLVSLWTWAVQNACSGDLSSCSDRAIADAARYRRKPEVFVSALIDAGWLDEDRHLHDWEEYTALLLTRLDAQKEKTRQRVKRYRNNKNAPDGDKKSASCNSVCNVTVTQCNVPTIPLPIPLPVSNISAPNTVDGAPPSQETSASFDGQSFTAFWDAYPSKIDRNAAWEAWRTLRPDVTTARMILQALGAWKISSQWAEDGGRFIPRAAKFLTEGHYKSPPVAKTAVKSERQMDADEQEAIRRMMAEPT